jgi:UrcA family protein
LTRRYIVTDKTATEEILMSSNLQITSSRLLAYSTALLLGCMLFASTSVADEQIRTETVRFQDLNVDTPAGAEALYGRIHSAAARVCSQPDQAERARADACARNAEAQAIENLQLRSLVAYYRTKSGGRADNAFRSAAAR